MVVPSRLAEGFVPACRARPPGSVGKALDRLLERQVFDADNAIVIRRVRHLLRNYGGQRRFQANASTDASRYASDGVFTGHFHGQRTGTNHTELFRNGICEGSSEDKASQVANKIFLVGAGASSGGACSHSTASISTAHIGANFSSREEIERFDKVIRSYLSAVAA